MASQPRPGLVVQRGRAKAFRPLSHDARRGALRDGLAAYARGDFFLAHELLEPAWMGTADPAERDFHQGLIKLAAAQVHAVRGNAAGQRKNLVGARERLADPEVASFARRLTADLAVDLAPIVGAVDDRLRSLAAHPGRPVLEPVPLQPPQTLP